MRRRHIATHKDENYASLYDTADGIDSTQYEFSRRKLSIKSIIYILMFFIAGTVCLTISILIFGGYFDDKYSDRVWPLFIVGAILMIPGGYYGHILFCIAFGVANYTADDIPVF